jgi:carbonic anhydrase
MEMHMVHKSEDNSLAVYAVFFNTGKQNDNFTSIISNLPNKPGEKKSMEGVEINLSKLLPEDTNAYHFMGSLTTPPCTENVNWMVAVQPVELSADQINEFSKRLGKNNRPTQALNDRMITVDNVE